MNERIKELAEQAGMKNGFSLNTGDSRTILRGNDIEKFAELIVKECIQQLRYKSAQLVDVDYFPEYKEQLEKHFGIKEN